MKDEFKQKIFYTFKNEKIGKMEFFERWCPENHVYNSSNGDEEDMETKKMLV